MSDVAKEKRAPVGRAWLTYFILPARGLPISPNSWRYTSGPNLRLSCRFSESDWLDCMVDICGFTWATPVFCRCGKSPIGTKPEPDIKNSPLFSSLWSCTTRLIASRRKLFLPLQLPSANKNAAGLWVRNPRHFLKWVVLHQISPSFSRGKPKEIKSCRCDMHTKIISLNYKCTKKKRAQFGRAQSLLIQTLFHNNVEQTLGSIQHQLVDRKL